MKVLKYSSLIRSSISSNEVRSRFIDFFKSNDHDFIRSSPVLPFGDSTLDFVNAGMNQFKNTFLGLHDAPTKRAVNSQKCIRVGGKHNDLDIVGHDSYHHTFFEMLGNWSFNDYFKEEACDYALRLVTSYPFSLPLDRLYFTYFGGDSHLDLAADFETKQVWKDLGVPEDRILPFGLRENFWEMGLTGPCGPCTEIHYDHRGTDPRPHLVNKDLPDLTELWNLVFVQYRRNDDKSLSPLKQYFVDTGLGLERLVALLQGKSSNYDTDLFTPLFTTIHEESTIRPYRGLYGSKDVDNWDTTYRILADHTRMVTIALSDNMLPDNSHGLRRVIRKVLECAEEVCPSRGVDLLVSLSHSVASTLHVAYPEITHNLKQVEMILRDEACLWSEIQETTRKEWTKLVNLDKKLKQLSDCKSIGLIDAYKFLKPSYTKDQALPLKDAVTCYDRYGLNVALIEELASIKGFSVDIREVEREIGKLKEKNKALLMLSSAASRNTDLITDLKKYPVTNDSHKFVYSRSADGKYSFGSVETKALSVTVDGVVCPAGSEVLWDSEVGILLEATNFHSSSKGACDVGHVVLTDRHGTQGILHVTSALNYSGRILHFGRLTQGENSSDKKMEVNDWTAETHLDESRRMSLMVNSTASYLMDVSLQMRMVSRNVGLVNSVPNFKSKFLIFGQSITSDDLLSIENDVNSWIKSDFNLKTSTIHSTDLMGYTDATIPPYINIGQGYFQTLSFSPEESNRSFVTSCPNVLCIKDISCVGITSFKFSKRNREMSVTATAGSFLQNMKDNNYELLQKLEMASCKVSMEAAIADVKSKLREDKVLLTFHDDMLRKLDRVQHFLKTSYRKSQEDEVRRSVREAVTNGAKHVIVMLRGPGQLDSLAPVSTHLPTLLFNYDKGHLSAHCSVPQGYPLTAKEWLSSVMVVFGERAVVRELTEGGPCSLRPVRVDGSRMEDPLLTARNTAQRIIESKIASSNSS